MKALFFNSFLFIILFGLIISCNHNNNNKVTKNNIQFDSLMIDKEFHLMDIDTNPGCSLQIKFIYPVDFNDTDILNALQQQFIKSYFGDEYKYLSPEDAVDKYVNDYIIEYKSQEKDFVADQLNHGQEPNESWYSHNETSDNEIVYNRNGILSLVINKEYYMGGAHNAHSHLNYCYNLKTGNQITESEIFIDDYQDDLAEIIVREIAHMNELDEAKDLENMGFFDIKEIYPNKNFYINATGITYTFNEYDIAAYVVGPTIVHIHFDKIQHLLRKESSISTIAF